MNDRWKRPSRLIAAVVAFTLVATACGGNGDDSSAPAQVADLRVELRISDAAATIPAVVTVTNGSDRSITLVRPNISPNFVYFEVRDAAGEALPFDGPWLSLRPREADDVIDLGPGESVEQEFDLSQWYPLAPGTYTVTAEYVYDGSGGGEAAADAVIVAGIMSPAVELEVG